MQDQHRLTQSPPQEPSTTNKTKLIWGQWEDGWLELIWTKPNEAAADAQSSDANTGSFPSAAMTDGKENDTGEQTANVQMI